MKTSRQRLLDYLASRGRVTVEELSRALRMTPANARHHLSVLVEQGSVEVVGQQLASGRGRPALVYGLAAALEGNNLDRLGDALLVELLDGVEAEERKKRMQRLADRICGSITSEKREDELLSRKLVATVKRLNEMNYRARWEARSRAPSLILGRCPYAAIIDHHPELCTLDAALLETMLGVRVSQITKLAPDGHGNTQCLFSIRPGEPAGSRLDP